MRFIVMLLLAVLPTFASAVVFDETTQSLTLGPQISVFEDVRGELKIDDIDSPAMAGSFRAHDKNVLNAGYSRSVFWLRIDLDYQPQKVVRDRTWLLELAYPPLDHVDLYGRDEQGGYSLLQRSGDALPFSSRQIKQHNYLYALHLPAGESTRYYLRVESQGSIQVPLTLWSTTAFIESQPEHIYVLGIIYGVLLVMMIYNLFIFFSVRDVSYLYYILYIASFGMYQVSVNGAGVQYLWPDNPWWANISTPLLIGSAVLFGSEFARSFLQTRLHSRWVDRCLMTMMLAGAGVMFIALTNSYALSLRLATGLSLVFIVVIFAAGIIAGLRGMRVARYFIVAWSTFLIGGMVNTLMVLGFLPNVFLTMYASQIGSALEVALLSLALADRINTLKEERARILQQSTSQLAALNSQLATSNRLKDEFLATVTHELRTPMNGVIGSLELLKTLELDNEAQQYQQTAAASARDMMHMVNDILVHTELQAGKLHLKKRVFSLRGLLNELYQLHAGRASEKNLQFKLDVDETLLDTLEGDADKLKRALTYLLDNAIKFTATGSVCLSVVRGVAPANNESVQALSFRVIDTGAGIEVDTPGQVFQSFWQQDGSLTRQYGGLGIGLSICQQLADLLKGHLSYQPQAERGSCFTLDVLMDLPAAENASPHARQSLPSIREPQHCKVLVVEDDPINQLVIRGMLLKLGYQVLTAGSGAEALEVLRRERIDGVLLDCQMPGMDGFAVCRALRQMPACQELPVLAVTAHSQAGDRDRCLAAGMSDYLAKPLNFEQLRQLLQAWLLTRPY
ncbi:MAG: hybrid sensor histidine kinase/response regulator [Pseudomonadaceae bacterium]|nr:hybrid sensor histidine kinase/response regulator [Pseudomonadaceae bacterium]